MSSKQHVKQLEYRYMKEQRLSTYIMLEDVDINWNWDARDVVEFDSLFKKGWDIMQLAEKFDRTPDEIGLMIFDRAMQGKIKGRRKVV